MKSGKSKWNRLLRGLRLDLQSPMASDSMVDWWLRVRLEHNIDIRKGFDSLVLLTAWCIWREHNQRVFYGLLKRPQQLLEDIFAEGNSWLQAGFRSLAMLLDVASV
jgi:hypothetical protein